MKSKTKKIFKILILVLIVCCIMFSNNIVLAEENTSSTEEEGITTFFDDGILDGILGVLFYFVRLIPVLIGGIIQLIAGRIASIGATGAGFGFLTMEDILFNKVPIVSVNFFNAVKGTDVITGIRNNIAVWYYALRNVAIILSLAVLIYVGIRMAISTLAEDKAKYKKMLTDWVVGFITIFLLHYIIIITVNVNDLFVKALQGGTKTSAFENFAAKLVEQATNPVVAGFVDGLTGGIVYLLLVAMILMFLFNYIKRMLTVAFLIIIAPIITVTYSIDKMGDGKSQALNTWMKEFMYNVLIQPFHCIIYLVFMTIILTLITSSGGIGAGVISIVVMFFIKQAENIVKKIFGFENASTLGSALASGALLAGSMKLASNAAKKASSGGDGAKSGGSSGGSSGSKPQPSSNANRNTANMNQPAPKKSQNPKNSGGKGKPNPGNGSNANSGGGSGSGNGSNANSGSGTGNTNADSLNTNRVGGNFAQRALKNAGKFALAQARFGAVLAGAAIGSYTGDNPITDAMTGANLGKALNSTATNLGGRAYSKLSNGTRRTRMVRQRNDIIDAYNDLKSSTGWSDDRMYQEAENLLQVKDVSKIKNKERRNYAAALQRHRQEFEGRYEEPNDMVLDTINKIQDGTITKNTAKRYTRKRNP